MSTAPLPSSIFVRQRKSHNLSRSGRITMSHWHESSCRHPDVELLDGLPCCRYCFAIASGSFTETAALPELRAALKLVKSNEHRLSWPAAVKYTQDEARQNPSLKRKHASSEDLQPEDEMLEKATVFPKLTSSNEFRLLKLKAGRLQDPLHVHMEVVSRGSPCPSYKILSYSRVECAAFQTGKRSPIFLGPYWDILVVPTFAEEALRDIRFESTDLLIWIDIICINQSDIDEKNQQTSVMREIVQKASGTMIYLSAAKTEEVFNLIMSAAISQEQIPPGGAARRAELENALQTIFRLSYFSDLLVIQEVLLATKVELVWGHRVLPCQGSLLKYLSNDVHALSWWREHHEWTVSAGRNMVRLLSSASKYSCIDPRDKVFGVLALVDQHDIVPDYRLPVELVYIGITAYLIQCHQTFELLELAAISGKGQGVPSWVPDWSYAINTTALDRLHDPRKIMIWRTVSIPSLCQYQLSSTMSPILSQTSEFTATRGLWR